MALGGRGTPSKGRTLLTSGEGYSENWEDTLNIGRGMADTLNNVVSKVNFKYFRFRKSQDYTRFETETISGTLPQTKLHSGTSISRNTVFVC